MDAYNASTDGSCYSAQPLGIAINKNETYSKVFPNPASTSITVSFDNANNEVFTFNMFNLSGQSVLSTETSQSAFQVDVSNLSTGLYTYRLISTDNTIKSMGQVIVE